MIGLVAEQKWQPPLMRSVVCCVKCVKCSKEYVIRRDETIFRVVTKNSVF